MRSTVDGIAGMGLRMTLILAVCHMSVSAQAPIVPGFQQSLHHVASLNKALSSEDVAFQLKNMVSDVGNVFLQEGRAQQLLRSSQGSGNVQVSAQCVNHTAIFLDSLKGQLWAISSEYSRHAVYFIMEMDYFL